MGHEYWSIGSSDYADMLVDIQGGPNLFDVDIGGNASAEYLNFDLVVLGSRNDFDGLIYKSQCLGGTRRR